MFKYCISKVLWNYIKKVIIYCTIIIIFISIPTMYLQSKINNNAPLSINAPTDRPHSINNEKQLREFDILIKPYVSKALKTLPKAKSRFLKGLNKGEAFFLTTRIYDYEGNFEQIFVRVISWNNNLIKGTIANRLNRVKGFKYGQLIEFPEKAVLDWLITKANGKEEGNFVGKFLDTLR